MRIEYEGESYEFDMDDITVKQGIKIEKHLGCSLADFGEMLNAEDGKTPDLLAVQCLGWLILHGGRGIPIEDTDFKVTALSRALGEAMEREAASQKAAAPVEEGAPVPTGAALNGQNQIVTPLSVP
jgi:hypothetical protein